MKKLSFALGVLMAGAGFLTGCSDNDPAPFENIKSEPVAGDKLTVEINGETVNGGTLTVEALSDTKANIKIENIVNGYPTLVVPVDMEYTGENFKYTGSAELPKPTVAARAFAGEPGVFHFTVSGVIAGDGSTVSADMTTSLTEYGRGDVKTGVYALSTTIYGENSSLSDFTPVFLEWVVKDSAACGNKEDGGVIGSPDADNKLYVGSAVKMLGSQVISEFLNKVDFIADGALSADYYNTIIPTDYSGNPLPADAENIQSWLMSKFFGGAVNPYQREWIKSPANLVNWYADKEYVYILPNINAIVSQAVKDGGNAETAARVLEVIGSLSTMTDEELQSTISSLSALLPEDMDIDLSAVSPALVRKVLSWFVTGVPLKYRYEGEYFQLYVDKEMVEDFMPLVLSVGGPVIEKLITEMAVENPMLSIFLPAMVQLDHITDLLPIWKDNTASFELGITFQTPASAAKVRSHAVKGNVPMTPEQKNYIKSFIKY